MPRPLNHRLHSLVITVAAATAMSSAAAVAPAAGDEPKPTSPRFAQQPADLALLEADDDKGVGALAGVGGVNCSEPLQNCQDFATGGAAADHAFRSWEDFRTPATGGPPGSIPLSTLCVWGLYFSTANNTPFPNGDCFLVGLYSDDSSNGSSQIPGTLIEQVESGCRGDGRIVSIQRADSGFNSGTLDIYEYVLTISPPIHLNPDTCYWLEVSNIDAGGLQLQWAWSLANAANPSGNLRRAQDVNRNGLIDPEDACARDLALCLPFALADSDTCVFAPPAPNQTCATASLIACNGGVVAGDHHYGNPVPPLPAEPQPETDCPPVRDGVAPLWYRFVATATSARVSTCATAERRDTIVSVYGGTCGSLVELAASDNACGVVQAQADLTVHGLTIGATYFIQVSIFGATVLGLVDVEVICPGLPQPANDDCGSASALTIGGAPVAGTTIGATCDPDAQLIAPCAISPSPTAVTAPGVWFAVVGNGATLTVSLCSGSDPLFDSIINVFCGACDNLTCVAGDDDFCGVGSSSQVSFCSVAGARYRILVSGFGEATGNFAIAVSTDGVGCAPSPVCPTLGACCFGATCQELTEADCLLQGGRFLGEHLGCPPCPFPPADANCDGVVNGDDIDAYFDCLFNGICPHPNCPSLCTIDFNCDLSINFFDLEYAFQCFEYQCGELCGHCGEPECGLPPCPGTQGTELCGQHIDDGCDDPSFQFGAIACGETVCGNYFAQDGEVDSDWYEFTLTQATGVTWTVQAGSPARVRLLRVNNCAPQDITIFSEFTSTTCGIIHAAAYLTPGTYVAYIAPPVNTGIPCTPYIGTLSCTGPPGAVVELPPTLFQIDRASAVGPLAGLRATDILMVQANAPPIVLIPGENVGAPNVLDEMDGLGSPPQVLPLVGTFLLRFSVDGLTQGAVPPDGDLRAVGLPYNVRQQFLLNQAAGDEFVSTFLFDQGGVLPSQLLEPNNCLSRNQSDAGGVDYYTYPPTTPDQPNSGDPTDNGDLGFIAGAGAGQFVFFSLTRDSPSLAVLNPPAGSGADIFVDTDLGSPGGQAIYATAAQLGLVANDDIDCLVVFDDGDNVFEPLLDQVLFSLDPASPTLAAEGYSAADVLTHSADGPVVFTTAASLGLRPEDNLDGLELVECANPFQCIQDWGIGFLNRCPSVRADVNCDGARDFFDIDPFLMALFEPATYLATHCGGSRCAADINCDDAVDFFDIDPFLACIFTACPACP